MGPKHPTYQVSPQATYRPHTVNNTQHNNIATTNSRNLFLVVPYSKGLSVRFSKTCRSLGMQFTLKGSNTVYILLAAPTVKDSNVQKSGIIYRYKCIQMESEEEYSGEWGIGKDLGEQAQRTPHSPLPYLSPYPGHQCGLLHHNRQGGT